MVMADCMERKDNDILFECSSDFSFAFIDSDIRCIDDELVMSWLALASRFLVELSNCGDEDVK